MGLPILLVLEREKTASKETENGTRSVFSESRWHGDFSRCALRVAVPFPRMRMRDGSMSQLRTLCTSQGRDAGWYLGRCRVHCGAGGPTSRY